MNDALRKVAAMPDVSQRFDAIFVKPIVSSPAELKAYLEAEHAKWRGLAGKLNIQFN